MNQHFNGRRNRFYGANDSRGGGGLKMLYQWAFKVGEGLTDVGLIVMVATVIVAICDSFINSILNKK
jgi:hypothetical protein